MMNRKNILQKADWIFLGVLLHNIGLLTFWSLKMQALKFLMYVGPICFLYGLYVNRQYIIRKNTPFVYKVLLVISLWMWLRFDINGANSGTVQDVNGAFSMFFFLLLLYNPKLFKLSDMKRWTIIAAVCGLVFAAINWRFILAANAYQGAYSNNEGGVNMAMAAIYILMGCGFFLFIYKYFSKGFNFFCLFVTMLAVVIAMTSGRRGYTVINLMFAAQYIFFLILYSKGFKRIGAMIFVVAFLFFCYNYYIAYRDTQLYMFFKRLDTDSRSGVFYYWNRDMAKSIWYWIWGKGVSGGYWDGDFGFIRGGIENGMRHMILKGGLPYFLSYVLLSLRMAYLGWFKSSNVLCKGVALYIFFLFIFIFVWGSPSISYTHLFMWMGYAWIHSPEIREMTDKQVYACLT